MQTSNISKDGELESDLEVIASELEFKEIDTLDGVKKLMKLIHARDTKMLEHVISGDEFEYENHTGSARKLTNAVIRNKLKAEQRERARQWLGEI